MSYTKFTLKKCMIELQTKQATYKFHNVLRTFIIFCWDTFIAPLCHMGPMDRRLENSMRHKKGTRWVPMRKETSWNQILHLPLFFVGKEIYL